MERQHFKPTSRGDIAADHYEMVQHFNDQYVELLEVAGIFDDVREGDCDEFIGLIALFREEQLGEGPGVADNGTINRTRTLSESHFPMERNSGSLLRNIVAPTFTEVLWEKVKRGQIKEFEKLLAVQIIMAGSFDEAAQTQQRTSRQAYAFEVAMLLSNQAFDLALTLQEAEPELDRTHFEEAISVLSEAGLSVDLPHWMGNTILLDEILAVVDDTETSQDDLPDPAEVERMQWMSKMHPPASFNPDDTAPNNGAEV